MKRFLHQKIAAGICSPFLLAVGQGGVCTAVTDLGNGGNVNVQW